DAPAGSVQTAGGARPRAPRPQVADAVTDVDHRRDLVVEPGEVLRHRAVDAAEIVGLADEVSQMRRPPLPSTRVTNSLMVHSAGAVQLPNAWSRLSVPLRFSFG